MPLKYKRVLLKLSGEALCGEESFGIDAATVNYLAEEIKDIYLMGVEVGIVIGGGNIFRGLTAAAEGMDRVSADYMGMLATVINSLAVQDALEKFDVHTRVQTAIDMQEVAEPFIRRRAIRHLEKGRLVIFAAGTGNPYFSTDTAASLRAIEIKSEIILKATKVDGVYSDDPVTHPEARLIKTITHQQVIQRGLGVMDSTATALCMDNELPILVFNLNVAGNIVKAVLGEDIGTLVSSS